MRRHQSIWDLGWIVEVCKKKAGFCGYGDHLMRKKLKKIFKRTISLVRRLFVISKENKNNSIGHINYDSGDGSVVSGLLAKKEKINNADDFLKSEAADCYRWSEKHNLHQSWSSRAHTVSKLIGDNSVVLDIGCGNMDLEKSLPGGCSYIPADIVARDDRTLICDLNGGLVPAVDADVVTMLGVIEYIHDPQAALMLLASRWKHLILTFNPTDLDALRDRRVHGWVCNLKSAELVEVVKNAGFDLIGIIPIENRQNVYEFKKA
jgi:hypothetical protein